MEYPLFTGDNLQDRYAVNSFWGSGSNPPSNFSWIDTNIDLGNDFHTYGLEWNNNQLKYYFDGQLVKTASNQSSFQNMYLIFNYAVGGWPGSPSQAQWADGDTDTTQADWLRVWEKPASTPDTTWSYQASNNQWWGTDSNWTSDQPQLSRQKAYFPTLLNQNTMLVKWGDSKTVGEMYITGDTVYTFGEAGGDVESIMLADDGDGWARLWVNDGVGGHVVNSRLDAWSHLSIKNAGTNPLVINGDIIGQARGTSNGGRLLIRGGGQVNLFGDGRYQRMTEVDEGSTLFLVGDLYEGNVEDDAKLVVESGSTVSLSRLNDAGSDSLGNLPRTNDRLVLDDGTLTILGTANTRRGFTIGTGGARINADTWENSVTFESSALAGMNVDSTSGGTLTLGGFSFGTLNHAVPGTGGLVKTDTGLWTLGGTNTYTGTTQVQLGKLVVDGTTGSGLHTVSIGATLAGQGILGGQVSNQGTLAPGRPTELGQKAAQTGSVNTGVVTALDFDFTGIQDNAPLTQTSTLNSNLQLTHGLDFGPGLAPRNAGNAGNEFNVASYTAGGTLADALDAGDYLTFSVKPVPGVAMTLDTINVNLWRNGTNAATDFAIMTNLDGFSSGAQLGTINITDSGVGNQHLFSASYGGTASVVDEELEIRIYGWGAGTTNGNTHFNAVSLTADFVSVTNVALDPTGILTLNGDYTQLADGILAIDLGGADNTDPLDPQFDSLVVNGTTVLEGTLEVSLFNEGAGLFAPSLGESFEILTASGGITGQFSDLDLPALPSELAWHVDYGTNSVELQVISSADFDADGDVDHGDLTALMGNYGTASNATHPQGDADNDGDVDGIDILAWQRQYRTVAPATLALQQVVPEPTSWLLATGLLISLLIRRGTR